MDTVKLHRMDEELGAVVDATIATPQYNIALPPPGYEALQRVLAEAFGQSAFGKGKERHAPSGKPFLRQPIMEISRMVGYGYPAGQAQKKLQEAGRLPAERAKQEILGAIVYAAAAYLLVEENERKTDEE